MNIPDIAESARNSQLKEQNDFLTGQNQAYMAILNYLTIEHLDGEVLIPQRFQDIIKDTTFQLIPTEEGYVLKSSATTEETKLTAQSK